MSRAQRLLELMQALRKRRRPVQGRRLAEELGISLRTLYRDMAALKAQGACIDGEAGMGYLLRPGFTLPPLMFSETEIEAIGLGAKWVAGNADGELAGAAADVLAKIAAVIPERLRAELHASPLLVGPVAGGLVEKQTARAIRAAIRREAKVALKYRDAKNILSSRTIWPFGLAFFEQARVLLAWCEKRVAFRHFRLDRIQELRTLDDRYPVARGVLLAAWRKETGIEDEE